MVEETESKNTTMVRLKKTTKARIEKLGDLSDTWDTLLNDMAEFIEGHEDEWWDEIEEEE